MSAPPPRQADAPASLNGHCALMRVPTGRAKVHRFLFPLAPRCPVSMAIP